MNYREKLIKIDITIYDLLSQIRDFNINHDFNNKKYVEYLELLDECYKLEEKYLDIIYQESDFLNNEKYLIDLYNMSKVYCKNKKYFNELESYDDEDDINIIYQRIGTNLAYKGLGNISDLSNLNVLELIEIINYISIRDQASSYTAYLRDAVNSEKNDSIREILINVLYERIYINSFNSNNNLLCNRSTLISYGYPKEIVDGIYNSEISLIMNSCITSTYQLTNEKLATDFNYEYELHTILGNISIALNLSTDEIFDDLYKQLYDKVLNDPEKLYYFRNSSIAISRVKQLIDKNRQHRTKMKTRKI